MTLKALFEQPKVERHVDDHEKSKKERVPLKQKFLRDMGERKCQKEPRKRNKKSDEYPYCGYYQDVQHGTYGGGAL